MQDALGDSLSTTGVSLCAGVNSFPLALSPRAALSGVPQLTLAVRQPDGVEKSLVLDLSKQVWQGVQASIGTLKGDLATALRKVATGDRFGADQLGRVVEQLRGLRGNLDVLASSAAVAQAQVEAAIVQVDQLLQAAAVSAIDRAIRKKFGRGVEEKDLHGRVPLIEAIDQGDEAGVELVLKHPQVDLKAPYPIAHRKDMPPCPALHYAIIKRGDDTAIMQQLLEAGADMHARVFIKKRPLPFPNFRDDEQVVYGRKTGLVAELMAAALAHGVIKKTIWASHHMLPNQDYQGETALHIAVQERSLATVKLLLDQGIDVNAKNGYWQTPLHLAEDAKVAQYLLTRGANVNAVDLNDNTPLHYAVLRNSMELVQLITNRGANPHLKNSCCGVYASGEKVDTEGVTALEMARRSACSKQMVECLSQRTTE